MPHVASCGARRRRGHDALASDNLIRSRPARQLVYSIDRSSQKPLPTTGVG